MECSSAYCLDSYVYNQSLLGGLLLDQYSKVTMRFTPSVFTLPLLIFGGNGTTMAEKSHKRRRQTVVCTSCRRRKIACDRNAPCAQCIQANLECTYHRGYHDARNDFPTDRHDSAHSKVRSSSSASSMQATSQGYAPESLANVDYQSPVFEMNVASALPAALSVDMSAPSWFETEILGALDQPLGTPIDANGVTLFSPNTTNTVAGLSDAGPGAGRPALPPPLYSESFSAEPGEPLFSKGRVYGPTHWMTILRKVSTVQQESQVICCKVCSAARLSALAVCILG